MRNTALAAAPVAVVLLATRAPGLRAPHPPTTQDPAWQLEDQRGRRYTDADLRGRVVLFTGGDRAGGPDARPWLLAVRAAVRRAAEDAGAPAPDSTRFVSVGVADLRGVPRLMRGLVRRLIPKNDSASVLLDFDGVLARQYHFEPGACNVVVLGADGRVAARTSGTGPTPERVAYVAERVRQALAASAAPAAP